MKLQTSSDVARLVKNTRAQQDLTQQDVADAVGITRQSLARLERGNGGISFDTVLLILDHLGIHLDASTARHPVPPAGGAAQAAADALTKRITPALDVGTLKSLNEQILGSLPAIAPPLLPKIDNSDIVRRLEANLDRAALASIRAASRGLAERLSIPGSVLNPPRAVDADPPDSTDVQADTGETPEVDSE
ncbi:helix-turn-helix transcriptional regulator [Microbacterium sp. LjRoot45]|uniref:helix-turn-helix transcriptional regulator n=1 Tax=Microbacterium sp. LjRoot45 TaxID=3342329 RepID=UPI003ECE1470